MTCIDESTLVEQRIDRVNTEYRESPKFLHMLRTYLGQVAQVHTAICDLPAYFDLNTAVGDQLTIIGKRLGFPRCHCVCDIQPVFGFLCGEDTPLSTILGFCDSVSWADCGANGISEVCIDDDELYRKFLKIRRYQMLARYSLADLTECIQIMYGPTATVLDAGHGRVVLAPFRELSDAEIALLQVVPRVMPLAPGIYSRWHFGTTNVFGFGEGWGSFCEEWEPDGLPLGTENGDILVTENDEPIYTGPLTRDADWMCEIDLRPYSC